MFKRKGVFLFEIKKEILWQRKQNKKLLKKKKM